MGSLWVYGISMGMLWECYGNAMGLWDLYGISMGRRCYGRGTYSVAMGRLLCTLSCYSPLRCLLLGPLLCTLRLLCTLTLLWDPLHPLSPSPLLSSIRCYEEPPYVAMGLRATLQGYDVRPPRVGGQHPITSYLLHPAPTYVVRCPLVSAEKKCVPRPPFTTPWLYIFYHFICSFPSVIIQ